LCLAVCVIGVALLENTPSAFGQDVQAASGCKATLITRNSQAQPEQWFSINSGSAADIVSAAKCTAMFQSALQGDDLIAKALQTGTLAAPVLVQPYRQDVGLTPFWVVPVVDANNHPLALLGFLYNAHSRLLHEGEFDAVTDNMFYVNRLFPAIDSQAAIAAVSTEQQVAADQGRPPELIYFPGNFSSTKISPTAWHGGGTAITDPIWRVAGEDGAWHYVDHDGHAHLSIELPVDPDYPPMPADTTTE